MFMSLPQSTLCNSIAMLKISFIDGLQSYFYFYFYFYTLQMSGGDSFSVSHNNVCVVPT